MIVSSHAVLFRSDWISYLRTPLLANLPPEAPALPVFFRLFPSPGRAQKGKGRLRESNKRELLAFQAAISLFSLYAIKLRPPAPGANSSPAQAEITVF
jgi:hypothetical protein